MNFIELAIKLNQSVFSNLFKNPNKPTQIEKPTTHQPLPTITPQHTPLAPQKLPTPNDFTPSSPTLNNLTPPSSSLNHTFSNLVPSSYSTTLSTPLSPPYSAQPLNNSTHSNLTPPYSLPQNHLSLTPPTTQPHPNTLSQAQSLAQSTVDQISLIHSLSKQIEHDSLRNSRVL